MNIVEKNMCQAVYLWGRVHSGGVIRNASYTRCKVYSELSPRFEKNVDRIKFAVSTAPMFSEILSVSPSHTSLMAMVSAQWNLLFPVHDGRSDRDHAL